MKDSLSCNCHNEFFYEACLSVREFGLLEAFYHAQDAIMFTKSFDLIHCNVWDPPHSPSSFWFIVYSLLMTIPT